MKAACGIRSEMVGAETCRAHPESSHWSAAWFPRHALKKMSFSMVFTVIYVKLVGTSVVYVRALCVLVGLQCSAVYTLGSLPVSQGL